LRCRRYPCGFHADFIAAIHDSSNRALVEAVVYICACYAFGFRYRHWEIQDVYDSDYYRRMIRAAADYGMNGIQWSGNHKVPSFSDNSNLQIRLVRMGM
jgi:hypothetical protein